MHTCPEPTERHMVHAIFTFRDRIGGPTISSKAAVMPMEGP